MNFVELQREVKALIQDQSPSILLGIPDYINEAIQQVAEEIDIPSLKVLFSVTTSISTYYVVLPTGFSGKLRYVGDTNGEYTVLDGGLESLIREMVDVTLTGDIEYIAIEGNILYYLPIPTSAVTLTCIGMNVPATLTNDTDTPSDIPEYLHREIICNRAASIAYNAIEDGIEGDKINTQLFLSLAKIGDDKLRTWVSRRRSNMTRSVWSE